MQLSKIFHDAVPQVVNKRHDDCNNKGNNYLEFLFFDEEYTGKYIHKCNVCNRKFNLDKKYPCIEYYHDYNSIWIK